MREELLEILRDQVDGEFGGDDLQIVPDRQMPSLFTVRIAGASDYIVNPETRSVEKVRFDQWPPQ